MKGFFNNTLLKDSFLMMFFSNKLVKNTIFFQPREQFHYTEKTKEKMEMNTNLRTTEINLFEKKSEMGRSQTMNKRTKKNTRRSLSKKCL